MGSIADAVGDFAAGLRTLLLAAAPGHPAAVDIRASAALLGDAGRAAGGATREKGAPPRLPVCRFWDAALAAAGAEWRRCATRCDSSRRR
jgi:hypothetical protein